MLKVLTSRPPPTEWDRGVKTQVVDKCYICLFIVDNMCIVPHNMCIVDNMCIVPHNMCIVPHNMHFVDMWIALHHMHVYCTLNVQYRQSA